MRYFVEIRNQHLYPIASFAVTGDEDKVMQGDLNILTRDFDKDLVAAIKDIILRDLFLGGDRS